MCLVPLMMLLMMHQPHLHQPWRLDRCGLFNLLSFFFFQSLILCVAGVLIEATVTAHCGPQYFGMTCIDGPSRLWKFPG